MNTYRKLPLRRRGDIEQIAEEFRSSIESEKERRLAKVLFWVGAPGLIFSLLGDAPSSIGGLFAIAALFGGIGMVTTRAGSESFDRELKSSLAKEGIHVSWDGRTAYIKDSGGVSPKMDVDDDNSYA